MNRATTFFIAALCASAPAAAVTPGMSTGVTPAAGRTTIDTTAPEVGEDADWRAPAARPCFAG